MVKEHDIIARSGLDTDIRVVRNAIVPLKLDDAHAAIGNLCKGILQRHILRTSVEENKFPVLIDLIDNGSDHTGQKVNRSSI